MADPFAFAERLMAMRDADWRRHANRWSGLTRFTCLPLLVLAIYSRVWIGWWALLPTALALGWIWWNPRAFPVPRDFGSWMSRGVLGERIFLDRANRDLPGHHLAAANLLALASLPGAILLIWSLVVLSPLGAVTGTVLTILPKTWFVDRMVWLHVDVTGIPFGVSLPDPVLTPQGSPT